MRKIDEQTKEKFNEALDKNDWHKIRELTDIWLDEEVWFGDYFEGDEFKFYLHGFKYYQPTRESINEFLNDKDRFITDGVSDKVYTPEEVWQMVEDCKDGKNIEDVVKEMSEAQQALVGADMYIQVYRHAYKDIYDELVKYKPRYNEFHNDGLRFCI